MRPLRLLVLGAVTAGLAATITVASNPAFAQTTPNPRPQTIPALQEWTGGTGSYAFSSSARIVRATANATALATTSQVFADDLHALTGTLLPQVTGTTADLRAGDIHLALGSSDTRLGTEGYALSVTDKITITARDDKGAFYGTRTILQLLKQNNSIPQGTARDWALKPERGLMVDNGRKYFTVQWLKDHVKELAYLKMNYFHLHLSDNRGFRIESSSHPEVVSADHLTKQEVRDIIALAARYKITVVPEIDAPGHMEPILDAHPDLRVVDKNGVPQERYMDVSKPAAYDLMRDLYAEYLPLFPAPYFHIGADEYHIGDYSDYPQLQTYARAKYGANANGKDAYLGFINWANDIIRAAGKTTRAWSDGVGGGAAVTVNPNIILEYWYNMGKAPQDHINAGHTVSNESWDPTYYVLYPGGPSGPRADWGYDTWTPDLFQGNRTINDPSKNLGSKIHVWCDNPDVVTEERIASDIRNGLRMLAQQTWGSPKLVTPYTSFATVINTIGRNPAWPASARANLAAGKPVTVSSTETSSFPGTNAVDGNYSTRWSSAHTDNEWLTVDLGVSRPVSRVKLHWEAAYGKGYQVQVSNDNTNWTTIYTTTTGDGGVDDLTGLSGSGRYVRMRGTARATVHGFSLFEIEVYVGSPVMSGSTYQINALGKSMDVPLSTAAGTQLTLYSSHTGSHQKFAVTAGSDGAYTVKSVYSGLCLDVSGSSKDPGAPIIQWTCTGSANQKWTLVPTNTGHSIVSKSSGLAITPASSANGAKLTQQTNAGTASQSWTFVKV
ncbi:family 20 glycosylhydrolase [Actinokineospora sp. HUAS TT18]|uniref:family 20 glycosylhydrolase n=1 Tax=Actinokineospora sp. HUAS TT18 TaxID=3447451 RepID=UPI003F528597